VVTAGSFITETNGASADACQPHTIHHSLFDRIFYGKKAVLCLHECVSVCVCDAVLQWLAKQMPFDFSFDLLNF